MQVFTVTTRKTFQPTGTEEVEHYYRIGKGVPCVSMRRHMTESQATEFTRMVNAGERQSRDIVAGSITAYSITEK